MSRRVLLRLVDGFFRHWALYLVPVVLLAGLGLVKVSGSKDGYRSVGVLTISTETVLGQLSSVRTDGVFGYDTPAAVTGTQISGLLGTDVFIASIAEKAGLTSALEDGTVLPDDIRSSIAASPSSSSLLSIAATTEDPELSRRLAQGTIDSFIEYLAERDVSDSRAAEEFYLGQLATAQQSLDEAEAALQAYVDTHPGPALEERPLSEQVEIQRLQTAVTNASEQADTARSRQNDARLLTEQAISKIDEQYRVVDIPRAPTSPEPQLRRNVLTVAMFMAAGALLAGIAVVLGVAADRTMRFPEDVHARLGLPVLAELPTARRMARQRGGAGRATASPPASDAGIPALDPLQAPAAPAGGRR